MLHLHQSMLPSLTLAALFICINSGCHKEPPGKLSSVHEVPATTSQRQPSDPGGREGKTPQPDAPGSDADIKKISPKTDELVGESPIRRELAIRQSANIFVREGRILLPPYRLIQTDYRLILEGANLSVLITEYPAVLPDCPESLPALPDYIKPDSSWEQIESHVKYPPSLFAGALKYYRCRFPAAEAARKFTEYLRGLPFMASAKWSEDPNSEFDPSKKQLLVVITKAGDRSLISSR